MNFLEKIGLPEREVRDSRMGPAGHGPDPAGALAASLERRGYRAAPLAINIGGRTIAEALQDTALAEGAQVLAMGGFRHSRFRDFILGGATKGMLADLRLPALISH